MDTLVLFKYGENPDLASLQSTIPAQAIGYINQLFKLEKNLEVLSPEGKKEQRLIQELPVLEAFWSWAESAAVGILPKSKLGTAFTYAFNQKEGLMNYLRDGHLALSTIWQKTAFLRLPSAGRTGCFPAARKVLRQVLGSIH